MTLAAQILKAPHIGSKDLRDNMARSIKSNKPVVVTEHGRPRQVLLPYEMMLDLIETVEDLQDKDLMAQIFEGKRAVGAGEAGIPVEASFKKIRSSRKS